ncbi:MAG TPA: energy transducer TonB [Longimicrobiaceae bacterium]|nr:energy transducer TonB [Longimicrobiaceae bacterium]
MTHRLRFALLAASLALPACTAFRTTSTERAALLSDAPLPMDRTCRVGIDPLELPPAAILVDSAALSAAVAEVWRQAGSPAGHVLIGMRYDARGVNVRRAVIERRVPAALADTLQKLVFAYRRALPEAEREWGVRLRLDLGERPGMRVGRSLICAPRARDPAAGFGNSILTASFGDVRQSAPSPGLAESAGAVWVRVALDAGGNVTDARVERTAVRPAAEQQVLRYVRNISFIPATEDGYPVPGQLTFALRLGR